MSIRKPRLEQQLNSTRRVCLPKPGRQKAQLMGSLVCQRDQRTDALQLTADGAVRVMCCSFFPCLCPFPQEKWRLSRGHPQILPVALFLDV
jgi:hypothetical protein